MSLSPPYSCWPNRMMLGWYRGASQSNGWSRRRFSEPGKTCMPSLRLYSALNNSSHLEASFSPGSTLPRSSSIIPHAVEILFYATDRIHHQSAGIHDCPLRLSLTNDKTDFR